MSWPNAPAAAAAGRTTPQHAAYKVGPTLGNIYSLPVPSAHMSANREKTQPPVFSHCYGGHATSAGISDSPSIDHDVNQIEPEHWNLFPKLLNVVVLGVDLKYRT